MVSPTYFNRSMRMINLIIATAIMLCLGAVGYLIIWLAAGV